DASESSVIYERIIQPERRWALFRKIRERAQSLSLESGAGVSVDLRLQGVDEENELLSLDGIFPSSEDERITVRFVDGDTRGFFRCRSQWKDGNVRLLLRGEDLFLEQKRKDFRLVIPESYPARFEVTMRAQGILPLQARVLDLNITGVSLEVDAKEIFEIGEVLEGNLRLGDRPSVSLAGEVRFRAKRPDENRAQIGLRFQHVRRASEANLMELIAYFHSDLFQLRRGGSVD
ncbi:MAG TPA: PilZ domain-containing protein, partial [Pseudobdellovibrionaceae bacterium]|nr:PilZ domain-containing protein [Pseudobdellovibrionaceae bacterium]